VPRVGQLHDAAHAIEQLHVQGFFQLPDLLRQRGLRHVQGLGGTRKILVRGNCKKIADMPQQHGRPPFYWSFL
jgi:hypothetical protein